MFLKKWTEGLTVEGRLLSIGHDSHKPPSHSAAAPIPEYPLFQLASSQKKDPCPQSPINEKHPKAHQGTALTKRL